MRNQNEDLFEDSRMSFGEHLEELRKVFIRSLIGIALGCVIGFLFAERVVRILQGPLEDALTNFYVADGKEQLRAENGYLAPELAKWLDDEQKIPENVLIDPGQLVTALRSVSPDFLDSVSLKPYRFLTSHFDPQKVRRWCHRWAHADSQDEDQVAQWKLLWSLLDDSDQQRVAALGKRQGQPVTSAEISQLTELMNGLLTHREIGESTVFAVMIEQPKRSLTDMVQPKNPNPLLEMRQELNRQFDPDLSQRMNRLLISKSFAEAIPDVQLDMVPITIWKSARFRSQSLGATETFMIWVKAGVVTGLLIASPWVFYQLWMFVAAGLYPNEQKYVYVFLPISLILFFAGVFLAFFFVFEPVLDFLFSFNARMGISPQPRINDWLSFVLFLPLGFGIAFQLPLVMLFSNRIELVSVEAYTAKWRIAVVAIFGLSMLLTPADPVSMVMLAVPLTGLYFLGIFLCLWLNKPSNPYRANPA